jgi:pSer/pThr/pTyr-binding forkhead associated (FHA) protein
VSALHAIVELLAGELTLVDDGLSRNGSYVNGERVRGMRRLRDHDMLRIGTTVVLVRIPSDAARRSTSAASKALIVPVLSEQQRRVLHVLSRPLRDGSVSAAPATNQEIADELHLSVAAVKLHLRALFEKFGIAHLPQNAKRLVLAQQALRSGLLTEHERP